MTDRIKALREAKGWSQGELARRAKLRGAASISDLENGKGNPRLSTLLKIAKALDVHVTELFSDQDQVDPTTEKLLSRVKTLTEDEKQAFLMIFPRRGSEPR